MKNFDKRAYQRAWVANRRKQWFAANGPCVLCSSTEKLELDHLDSSSKVSHKIWSWSKDRREAELSKCRVLCRKCHTARHAEERIRHGANRYRAGCRCDVCREGKRSERNREKNRQLERQFLESPSRANYVPTNASLAKRQVAMREKWRG